MFTRLLAAMFSCLCATITLAETQDQLQSGADLPQFKSVVALLQQGRPAEVEQLLDRANWRSSNETFDIGDSRIPVYGFYSPMLIAAYVRTNRYADAERLAADGVNWSEKRYGSESIQVGKFVESMADLYRLEGKYGEAEPLYARSLSLLRKFDECVFAKESYAGMAEVYLANGRSDGAIQLLTPVIKKCIDSSAKTDLLNVYSISLESSGRPEEASKAAEEADRIGFVAPRFQQQDRDLLRARLLVSRGHFEEARSLCQKWITIFEVPDGKQSDRRLVIPLEQYEHILQNTGQTEEAEKVRARLDAIRAKYDMRL